WQYGAGLYGCCARAERYVDNLARPVWRDDQQPEEDVVISVLAQKFCQWCVFTEASTDIRVLLCGIARSHVSAGIESNLIERQVCVCRVVSSGNNHPIGGGGACEISVVEGRRVNRLEAAVPNKRDARITQVCLELNENRFGTVGTGTRTAERIY